MTKSVYARIADIKQTKHDKLVSLIKLKLKEIEQFEEQLKSLEEELVELNKTFPARKKAVYDEFLTEEVDRTAFEKIGYKIMVLEHEISAHKLKITSQEELVAKAKEERENLELEKKGFVKQLEKYDILIGIDQKEQKRIAEFKEDAELEEFSKPKK